MLKFYIRTEAKDFQSNSRIITEKKVNLKMISSVIVVIFFIFSNVLGLDLEDLEYEQTYHSGKYSPNFFYRIFDSKCNISR